VSWTYVIGITPEEKMRRITIVSYLHRRKGVELLDIQLEWHVAYFIDHCIHKEAKIVIIRRRNCLLATWYF
jgi:hypothetical protein